MSSGRWNCKQESAEPAGNKLFACPPGLPPSNILIPAQTAKKKELLNQQRREEGQLPFRHAAAGCPRGHPLPGHCPSFPCGPDAMPAAVPEPTLQKPFPCPRDSRHTPRLPDAAAALGLPLFPQKEVLLWWSTERPPRAANFPGLRSSWKPVLRGLSNPARFQIEENKLPQLCFAICLTFSLSPMQHPSNIVLYRKPFLSN